MSGAGAGEGGADVQRPLDGVLRRLVAQHRHRGVDVGPAAGLRRHVEELPGDHLRAAQVEHVERGGDPVRREPAAAQQLVGPAEQQVAEQDRRGRRRTARGRRASRRRGARPRTRGAWRAGRAGCRRRPCSRRAPARWRAAARGRRRPGAGRARRRRRAARRGSPSSRRRRGTVCRRRPMPRASSSSAGGVRAERGEPGLPSRRGTRRAPAGCSARKASAVPDGHAARLCHALTWTDAGRSRPRLPRLCRMVQGRNRSIGEVIREGERSFSFEFMPPKRRGRRGPAVAGDHASSSPTSRRSSR